MAVWQKEKEQDMVQAIETAFSVLSAEVRPEACGT